MDSDSLCTESDIKKIIYQDKENAIIENMKDHTTYINAMNDSYFKSHSFPLTRIRTIIKSDDDVKLISKDCSALMGKGCEFFIEELVCSS